MADLWGNRLRNLIPLLERAEREERALGFDSAALIAEINMLYARLKERESGMTVNSVVARQRPEQAPLAATRPPVGAGDAPEPPHPPTAQERLEHAIYAEHVQAFRQARDRVQRQYVGTIHPARLRTIMRAAAAQLAGTEGS